MMASAYPLLFGTVSPAGARGRLSILIFHRVLDEPDPLFPDIPDIARFEAQMRWIARWFNVLSLDEAVQRLATNSLPSRALAITFDDGYADNATVAAPLLNGLGLTATFFVTSGVLNSGRMWNDTVIEAIRRVPKGILDLQRAGFGNVAIDTLASRRDVIEHLINRIKRLPHAERRDVVARVAEECDVELPGDLMMTTEQLREAVRLGMTVGGHTVTHPILCSLDDRQAEREIRQGRDELRQLTGQSVDLFAYPNGVPGIDYDGRHVAIVRRCGFRAAVSTASGVASGRSDRYQLPRFTPWDRTEVRYGARMLVNLLKTQVITA